MVEIIPAILTDTKEEFIRLVRALESAGVTRVHVDVCDGSFVPTTTVTGYEELQGLETSLKFDVHLMVNKPEDHLDHWQGTSADRFIMHVESTTQMPRLVDQCHERHVELWAALNPDSPLELLTSTQYYPDGVMFLAVTPGDQGRPFIPQVLDRIKNFLVKRPGVAVMVDGGITLATAPGCIAAGASALVSGSFIVKSDSIEQAIEQLRNSVKD